MAPRDGTARGRRKRPFGRKKFLERVIAHVGAVPDTGCAKTLTGQSALKRHVEVSGKEPRWLSNVRPVRFSGLDDSTRHSQRAVELEWDVGEKIIRFLAHVAPGNWGLLLSRSDLKALGATINPTNIDSIALGKSENHPETLHDFQLITTRLTF